MTTGKLGWRERRKRARREQAERTGDSPQKRAERESSKSDVQDAASGAAIRGTVSTPPSVGGIGGGGVLSFPPQILRFMATLQVFTLPALP